MYLLNTLTPKDTWQDAEQLILNTNPIILDSRGTATIYGTGSYRQIVSDVDGNLIWDRNIEDFQSSVFGPQSVLTAATTTDLGSVASNNILIQGTTTINSFGTSASLANPVYLLQFANITTLTYNPTSMILPGAANITTAAGDSALVEFTNVAGYWRMISYFSGATGGGFGTAANQNIGTSGANVPLLSGNNIWSGTNSFTKQTFGPPVILAVTAGSVSPDFSLGNNFSVSTSGNLGVNNPTNVQPGQSGVIAVTQTTGSLTMTWGGIFKAPGGISGVNLSGVNGAIDDFAYYVNSSSFIVITPILNPT